MDMKQAECFFKQENGRKEVNGKGNGNDTSALKAIYDEELEMN